MGCSTCISCKGTAILQSDPDKSSEKELGYMPMEKDITIVERDNSFHFDGRCFFLAGERDDEEYNEEHGGRYKLWITTNRPCRYIRHHIKADIDEIKRKLKRKWKKLVDADPYVDESLKGLWGRFRKSKQYPIIWLYLATHKKEFDAARGAGSRILIYTKGEVEPEVLETLWEKNLMTLIGPEKKLKSRWKRIILG